MSMFWIYPRHWGLNGKDKEIAKIRYSMGNSTELEIANKILELEYPVLFGAIPEDEDKEYMSAQQMAYDLDILDNRLKYGDLTKKDYDKLVNDTSGKGWVEIKDVQYDPETVSRAAFELDYNDAFVEELRVAGYQGVDDEEVVSQWMDHLFLNSLTAELPPESRAEIETHLATK